MNVVLDRKMTHKHAYILILESLTMLTWQKIIKLAKS